MMCDFNFDPVMIDKVKDICPLDKNNLFTCKVLTTWCPESISKVAQINKALSEHINSDATSDHNK